MIQGFQMTSQNNRWPFIEITSTFLLTGRQSLLHFERTIEAGQQTVFEYSE